MSCVFYKNEKKFHIDFIFETIKTNQNFDFIIINEKFVSNMKLKIYLSKLLNSNDVRMIVVNDNRYKLKF